MEKLLKEYFDRLIRIYEVGEEGVDKLRGSHVAVIGVGGLGSFSSLLLALNGVGHITVVDADLVELSNLNRQILYASEDVGLFKAEVAKNRLVNYVPFIEVDAYPILLNSNNIEKVLNGVDIIVDGLDNLSTRYLINRYSIRHEIPYVFAGVSGFEANISFLSPPETSCLECFYKGDDESVAKMILERGIINFMVGVTASLQVAEAIKYLIGLPPSLKNKLLLIDLKRFTFDEILVRKNPDCKACENPVYPQKEAFFNAYDKIYFSIDEELDLKCILREISSEYVLLRRGKLGFLLKHNDIDVAVSRYGTIIVGDNNISLAERIKNELLESCR